MKDVEQAKKDKKLLKQKFTNKHKFKSPKEEEKKNPDYQEDYLNDKFEKMNLNQGSGNKKANSDKEWNQNPHVILEKLGDGEKEQQDSEEIKKQRGFKRVPLMV